MLFSDKSGVVGTYHGEVLWKKDKQQIDQTVVTTSSKVQREPQGSKEGRKGGRELVWEGNCSQVETQAEGFLDGSFCLCLAQVTIISRGWEEADSL